MEIELLVLPDCPHRKAAEDLLRTALADVGLPSDFRVLTVSDSGDAARQGCSVGQPPSVPPGRTCSPVEVRQRLLDALYAGTPFRTILRDLGLTPNQVWGLTKTDAKWRGSAGDRP